MLSLNSYLRLPPPLPLHIYAHRAGNSSQFGLLVGRDGFPQKIFASWILSWKHGHSFDLISPPIRQTGFDERTFELLADSLILFTIAPWGFPMKTQGSRS